MIIDSIDMLQNQRKALEADSDMREQTYGELVTEPLRPFWETALAFMPPGQEKADPVSLLGLYGPAGNVEEGLQAIAQLEQAGSWAACLEALEQADRLLHPAEHGIALDRVLFKLALANPLKVSHLQGYTGFGGKPGQIILLVWPNSFNVPRLPAMAVHEFHHNVRLSYEPWSPQTTVGQYLVVEGLAEAFAAEMCGREMLGPWVDSLTETQHDAVQPLYREAMQLTGFNEIRPYMFGDPEGDIPGYTKKGLPAFAGYAVGFRIVSAYLRGPGKRPWKRPTCLGRRSSKAPVIYKTNSARDGAVSKVFG